MNLPLTLNTFMLLTLTLTLTPIILPFLLKNFKNSPTTITQMVKTSFLSSLAQMTLFLYSGMESITSHWEWKFIMNFNIPIDLKMDQYSLMFFPIALFITWSILQFATWYMASEPYITKFFSHLLIFLVAMMTLTIANNMLLLFISWEGVEIMSFLLIGRWHGWAEANTAVLQAVLYNCIGDISLILCMMWLAVTIH